MPPPKDITNTADLIGRTNLLFDLTHLALQTDSTRFITIMLAGSTYAPPIPGVSLGHHDLSHHGKDSSKLEQLKIVEIETMKTVSSLLGKLKQSQEDGHSLLDRTTVFLGSNLGDGSSHSTRNLLCCLPEAASGMVSTCRLIPIIRRRFAISSSACYNASAWKPTNSAAAPARSPDSR